MALTRAPRPTSSLHRAFWSPPGPWHTEPHLHPVGTHEHVRVTLIPFLPASASGLSGSEPPEPTQNPQVRGSTFMSTRRFGPATLWGAQAAHTSGQQSTRSRAPRKPSGYVTHAVAGRTKGNTRHGYRFIIKDTTREQSKRRRGRGPRRSQARGFRALPSRHPRVSPPGTSRCLASVTLRPVTVSSGFFGVSSCAHSGLTPWPRGRSSDLPPSLEVGPMSPDSSPQSSNHVTGPQV